MSPASSELFYSFIKTLLMSLGAAESELTLGMFVPVLLLVSCDPSSEPGCVPKSTLFSNMVHHLNRNTGTEFGKEALST